VPPARLRPSSLNDMSNAETSPKDAGRMASLVRALAGLGVAVGLLFAALALAAGAESFRGVPAWGWLALALACLLVRETRPAPAAFRPGRRPR